MTIETRATPGSAGLLRAIGSWSMIGVGINGIIGAGIYGLPSKAFAIAGPWSVLSLLLVAAAAGVIGLVFAEVSSRYSNSGGTYLYARDTFGPLVGFQAGWLRWLAGLMAWAANANLLVTYLGFWWPDVDKGWSRAALLTAVTVSLTAVHYVGVRRAALVSNVFAGAKLLPLAFFVLAGLFFIEPARFQVSQPPEFSALASSALLLMFAFTGFESLPIMAGEVNSPRRTMPMAVLGALGIVTVVYLLIQVVCIGTLPGLGESSRPVADAATSFLGGWGGALMAVGAVVSIAGNLSGQIFGTTRTLYAIAEQRQASPLFARTHPTFQTPHVAIVTTMAATLALALSGTFIGLLTLSTLSRIALYAITCVALPVLRRRHPDNPPRFRLPGGPWVAALGLVLSLALASQTTPRDLLILGGAVVAGLPLYWLALRRYGPEG
ncbi:MAG TPA: APC family permease [Thermoanaerobaculia bacterium]